MEKEWVPNITIGQDYDVAYKDATIHFDVLGKMADFFGRNMPVHLHADYCQIHLILSGKTLFRIDQNIFETEGVAAFYTPPTTPHAFLTESTAPGFVITIHNIHLKEIINELNSCSTQDPLLMPFYISQNSTKDSTIGSWEQLLALFLQLKSEWTQTFQYKQKSIEALVRLIIFNMLRLSDETERNKQYSQRDVLCFRKFNSLLESNFLKEKKIPFYCNALEINESRLNYLCKKITGISPKKMINNRIILEAKRLLSHTNKNLTEISYQLGYIDPSYFSRLFINNANISPSQFRKQQQQKTSLNGK